MARNGSGTYSLPTTFTASTDALAEDVNTQFEDVRDALTASLALDGQSTMTGQFKAADGSAAAPGISFGSDLNTGIYRIGADSYGFAAAGALVATLGTTGWTLATGKTLGATADIVITANIAANAVTLAKLATQADATVLANVSGGAAVPSAVTYSAMFDDAFGATQGQIVYRNATVWTVLTPGTSGQYLQTLGAAANPAWATVTTLPTQTGESGKTLTTNGTTASWTADNRVLARGSINVGTSAVTNGVNVASVSGTTTVTVTFTTALSSTAYVALATITNFGATSDQIIICSAKSTTTVTFRTYRGSTAGASAVDTFDFVIFG